MPRPVPSTAIKTYPPRGPMQQFRFADLTAFECFRCGEAKKSKLLTVYSGDWNRRLCNGCYGRLLSLYDIKAGTSPDDARADALALVLLSLVTQAQQREAERLLRTSEMRANALTPEALRFISTAEYVASHLDAAPQLEWSPAVIGLCKAFEIELVARVLMPLARSAASLDLRSDREDKDLGRVAAFCARPEGKPPELGAFAHFLQTTIHSSDRRETSALMKRFIELTRGWVGSAWILDADGCHRAIARITSSFRNPAAHTDELGKDHYIACRDAVLGRDGALWRLVLSTAAR